MENRKTVVVAVIGGGPAAVSLCAQFAAELRAKNWHEPIEFCVFERQDRIGVGLPFSSKADCFLLNLPTDVMEPIHGRRGDFTSWTLANPDVPKNTKFPPRRFFGDYLESVALETQRSSESFGLKINFRTGVEVTAIRQEPNGGFMVDIGGVPTLQADYICLCTGHAAPKRFQRLEGHKNYSPNPWAPDAYNSIDQMATVGVLGTRLTAIDVARRLIAGGHKGKIMMVSRSGLLPTVLPATVSPFQFKHLTLSAFLRLTKSGTQPLKLADLLQLLKTEILEAEGPEFDPTKFFFRSSKEISPLDWINRELKAIDCPEGRKWLEVLFRYEKFSVDQNEICIQPIVVLNSFYPLIPDLWPLLSEADQREFIEQHFSLLLTYLAAFPAENARWIRDHLVSGQLEVLGGLVETEPVDPDCKFQLKFDDGKVVLVDHVFNATGCDRDVQPDLLSAQMIQSGLVIPHPLGGLLVDSSSLRCLNGKNQRHAKMAAMGAATRGAALLTADMGTVAYQASRVAAWMAEDICQLDRKADDKRG